MQHLQLGRKMPIVRRLAAAFLAAGLLAAQAFSLIIPQVSTVALTSSRKRRYNHVTNNNIHHNNIHHIIDNKNNLSDLKNSNDSDQFAVATSSSIPLDSNSIRGSQEYHKLEERTRILLCRSKRGQWTLHHFQQAQDAVKEYASRQNGRSAVIIERVLRRTVEELMAGNNDNVTLDLVAPMYTLAIQGWAKSGEQGGPQRAEEFLDHMMKGYELGDVTLKPGISAFNAVLLAYANSQQHDAPQQALRVLQKLNDWNAQGRTDVKPNKESYAAILKAYSKIGDHQAPDLVHKLLAHMEKLSQQGFPSVKPDYVCKNVYLAALLEAMGRDTRPGSQWARLAHDYLVQMMSSPEPDGKPDTWSFNMVISAWSKTGSRDMVEHAEALVTQLEAYHEVQRQQLALLLQTKENGDDSGETLKTSSTTTTLRLLQQEAECDKTRPNTNTYNCLIACYGRSSLHDKGQRAHAILNRMKGLVETGVNLSVKPDTVMYTSVMNCYGKSQEKDAPILVEGLLREMQQLFEETGDRSTKPNGRSFNTCLDAWARSNLPNSSERIMDWIQYMQDKADKGLSKIQPDKRSYNAYLQALSKSNRTSMGAEAEQILDHIDSLYRKGGRITIKPDVLTFTNVIHCIAMSGADDALERAMAILTKMEDLHAEGYGDVRPNSYTYGCVINAAAKSKRPGKAKIAMNILRRMKSVALRPMIATYNNIINACVFSCHPDDDPNVVLRIALDTLHEAQSTCGANFITYGTCLRAVGSFEKDQIERWRLMREIFQQCCRDGQLTTSVMKELRMSVSAAQYTMILSEAVDRKTRRLRHEFTKNATGNFHG